MTCVFCGGTKLRPIEQGPAGATYTMLERCKCHPIDVTIAGLIERLLKYPALTCEKAAVALRALAQENERLHERLEDNHEYRLIDGKMMRIEVKSGSIPDGIECRDETIKLKRERILELKAERDKLSADASRMYQLVLKEVERADTIRAKTIEECKHAIVCARFGPPSHWGSDRPQGWHLDRRCTPEEASMHDNGCNDAFAAVRALAQTDEGTESDADLPTAEEVRGILRD